MPSICGNVRRKPKLMPEDSSMVLFGPGVTDVTSANKRAGSRAAGIGNRSVAVAEKWAGSDCVLLYELGPIQYMYNLSINCRYSGVGAA